jgi:osmotically-inducible protein OsmY
MDRAMMGPIGVEDVARARLLGNAYLALRNVSCAYEGGVLTLRGSLPSYYLKQVAQAAVASLDGVGRVVNEIEVGPARSPAARPDA